MARKTDGGCGACGTVMVGGWNVSRLPKPSTNWPVMTISANYPLWVNTLTKILDELGLTAGERDEVMAGTAARAYRVAWPAAPGTATNEVSAQPINGG